MRNNFLLILLSCIVCNMFAQTKHILHGYLLNEDGQPIKGIRIQALQSINIFSESDNNGHFQFSVPDLGSQELKLTVLTHQYALYNNPNSYRNTAIISADKQREGIINIFMTTGTKSRGQSEFMKDLTETETIEMEENAELSYSTTSNETFSMNQRQNEVVYERNISPIDSPIQPPITVSSENTLIIETMERGNVNVVAEKRYEVQIVAVSQENLPLKARYETLIGKTLKISPKNGRFIYTVPVNTAEEGRALIVQLSTPQMEQEGIKHPFMILIEPTQSNVASTRDIMPKPSPSDNQAAPVNMPPNFAAIPEPKLYPVPKAPSNPVKDGYMIQLQSSRFPMNSVAKRLLEADLGKIGEILYEYNDPNADIKYRYYVMKKFNTASEANVLATKLTELGIQSLVLKDRLNIEFK